MGSFPSQEQAVVHPSASIGSDSRAAPHYYPSPPPRVRVSHAQIKKLTRGRVLFLGLDSAGKSTIATHLVRSLDEESLDTQSRSTDGEVAEELKSPREYPNPTKSVHTATYKLEDDCYLQIIDVPGRRDFRRKWYTTALAISDTLHYGSGSGTNAQPLPLVGIVFVVDASDRVRFPIVADELVRLQKLKEHRKALKKTQFFLLLNKTDQVFTPLSSSTSFTSSPSEIDLQKQELHAARRTAMRAARRELKKCLDHQLRVDQRRNPSDYQRSLHVSAPAALSGGLSHMGPILPSGGPLSVHSASAAATSSSFTTALMTSILECCAHDRESIHAIHAWIKDEVKKVL